MQFRPCIDIHNGAVKQIVGSSLRDDGDVASENFVAAQDAAYFAKLYESRGIKGGHVILLNASSSEYYEATKTQALAALSAYPGGLQAGGGITPENAALFLEAGASHVIVTSYVFSQGKVHTDRLLKLKETVGKKHLVLDVSCRKYEDGYFVCTDRWQNKTDYPVTPESLNELGEYCDEFLIHAVDVEGKNSGIETDLVGMLSEYNGKPLTYAGGVHSYEDIDLLYRAGNGRINMTIGSALDLFGGKMSFEKVCDLLRNY